MAKTLDSPGIEGRFARLEPYLPIALALHGLAALSILNAPAWTWFAIAFVGGLGLAGVLGWRGSRQAVVVRAGALFVLSWALLLATGGTGSFFLVWLFVLNAVYPIVLQRPHSAVLPVLTALAYLALWPLTPQSSVPGVVVVAHALLLVALGLLTPTLGRAARRTADHLRQANADLSRTVDQYRALVEQAADGIFVADAQGHCLEVNPAGCDMLGLTRAEILGLDLRTVVAPDDLSAQPLRLEDLRAGKTITAERRLRRKDGTRLRIEVSARMLADGRLLGIARDVSAHHRAREALQASQDYLGSLMNTVGDAIFTVKMPERRIAFVNHALGEIFGYSAGEVIGQSTRMFYPDEASFLAFGASLQESLARGQTSIRTEHELLKKNGERMWGDIHTTLLFSDGQPTSTISVVRDTTQNKLAQAALRREHDLFSRIAETSPVGISVVDRDGQITFANARAEQVLGLTKDDITSRTYNAPAWHITDVDGQPFPDERLPFRRVTDTRQPAYDVRHAIAWPDGRRVLLSINAAPLFTAAGEVDGMVATLEDITDRLGTEQALQESEERYRTLFEESPISLWEEDYSGVKRRLDDLRAAGVQDLDAYLDSHPDEIYHCLGLIKELALNKATLSLYRVQSQAELLDHIDRIISRESLPAHKGLLLCIAEGHTEYRYEVINFTLDGERLLLEEVWVVSPGCETTYARVLIALVDVTERRRAEAALQQRLHELTAIHRVSQRLHHLLAPAHLAQQVIEVLEDLLHHEYAAVLLIDEVSGHLLPFALSAQRRGPAFVKVDKAYVASHHLKVGQGVTGWVAQHGQSLRLGDVRQDARYYAMRDHIRSELCVPLRTGDRVIGVINVEAPRLDAYTEDDQRVLETVAAQIAVAIENARLLDAAQTGREQLRALAHHLRSAREDERARIAREIHDEFGQALTALKMDLAWLGKRLRGTTASLRERVGGMSILIDETMHMVRRLATELRPGLLDDLGLSAALEWQAQQFAERTGLACELRLPPEELLLDPERATAFFRIFQELLTNVARHADATRVEARLEAHEHSATLTVADDGRGLPEQPLAAPASLGLLGIRERALHFGGSLAIHGAPGQGTTVRVRLPLAAPEAAGDD